MYNILSILCQSITIPSIQGALRSGLNIYLYMVYPNGGHAVYCDMFRLMRSRVCYGIWF